MSKQLDAILDELKSLGSEANRQGMARFGIHADQAFGVKHGPLREIAKRHKKDHALALELWDSGFHEARLLASSIDDPKQVTEQQLEQWVGDLDSWDICDDLMGHLVSYTPFAYQKALEWAQREQEFVRRAGFALMAWMPVHDKKASDERFDDFFPLIVQYATDERNFVKKAVNWALRQLGKRSHTLNRKAIATARQIADLDSKAARWIARDALKELESEKVQTRLDEKAARAR